MKCFCHDESQHICRRSLLALRSYGHYVSQTLSSAGQDSHDRGGARLSSCLMRHQNKLTSLHESPPVSRKEVFCCQKEEVTLCVCVCPLLFPENRRHCQCTMLRQGDSTVRVDALQRLLSHGQVLNWEVLLLSVQAWHCPWTAWSQDHIICNCTYKKKSSKSVGSCWSLRWTLYPALCPVWAETSHQTFSWFQDFTDASLHQHNVSTTAPVNYLFRGGKKHPVVNPQHGGEKGKDASQPVTASC